MGLLKMKQTGLIKRIIEALGLDNGAKGKFTPSESKPLTLILIPPLKIYVFWYSGQMDRQTEKLIRCGLEEISP